MSPNRTVHAIKSSGSTKIWLCVVLVLAALIRFLYLLELHRTPFFDHLLLDLASYDSWAQRIASGDWLGSRVFYQDPLYPYFLGILYAVFGHRLMVVYVLQLILGTMTCYLIYRLGRGLFSAPVGLLAGAFAALYKPFVFYDIQIEKSFLAVLLVTAACLLLVSAVQRQDPGALWIYAGLALGLVILIRGNYLLLLPIVLLGILFLNTNPGRGRAAALYACGAGLILLLSLFRNYMVGKDLVLTTAQAGQNFYIGNNPDNLSGMYRAPEFVRPDPEFEENDFAREAERREHRSLKPSEVSSYWMRRAWSFVMERPGDFLKLLIQKSALFWNNYEVPDNLDQYFFEQYSAVMRLWLPAFGLIGPLGIAGMILCLAAWRRIWTIYFFTLAYFISVVPFYVFSRYRLPVVPFLMVFGAQAAIRIYSLLRECRYREITVAGLVLALAVPAVNIPLVNAYNPSAINNLGAVLLKTGDAGNAEALFRKILGRRPDFADARSNLAVALLRKGEVRTAVAELREVVRLKPKQAGGYVNLGNSLLRQGDLSGASESYRQALELDPGSQEGLQGLGELRRREGDLAGAAEAFRQALRIAPGSAEGHNNLAITLMALQQYDDALTEFQAATRLDPNLPEAFHNKGVCLEHLKQPEAALEAYRSCIALRPDYAEAHNNMANLLAEKGDRNGALAAYLAFLRHWKGDSKLRDAVLEEVRKLK